ncbi:hypothetical protein A2U01_0082785, partial [Trifolium medium]|nr:hypothetical protein [Trifolium medium]
MEYLEIRFVGMLSEVRVIGIFIVIGWKRCFLLVIELHHRRRRRKVIVA